MEKWEEEWLKLVKRIETINSLRKEAGDKEKVNLKKSRELIEKGYEERMQKNLLEIELFLREVINEGKK